MRRNGFVITLVLLSAPLFAQDYRATIAGYVTDAAGLAVAEAKVRAVQTDTSQVTEATTNREGYYTLPYLVPATYEVEVIAKGFKKFRRENVSLLVAQKVDLDFKLEVGGVNSQITVTEEVDALQTADASGGLHHGWRTPAQRPADLHADGQHARRPVHAGAVRLVGLQRHAWMGQQRQLRDERRRSGDE
jgi:hypothetical protein